MIGEYNYGTGRRKTSVARVFIKKGKGEIIVKPPKERSSFEQTFLRALTQLTQVQRMRAMSSSGLMFNAYKPPFPIIPT